jgi:hypothetical protein
VFVDSFFQYTKRMSSIRQKDFGTWKVYCVCNVTFHAEFKYAIKRFPSPTVFVQWHLLLLIFRNFGYFLQWFFVWEQIFYMGFFFRGWSHKIYHYQITSCMCSETGSEWNRRWFMQLNYTKFCCFLCEWDSRDKKNHYIKKEWP